MTLKDILAEEQAELFTLVEQLRRNPSNGSRHEMAISDWLSSHDKRLIALYEEATAVEKEKGYEGRSIDEFFGEILKK